MTELNVTLAIDEPDGSFVERTPYLLCDGVVYFYEREHIVCGSLVSITRSAKQSEDLSDWNQTRPLIRKGRSMSFPRDLDEYFEAELEAEMARRKLARDKSLCDYCGREQFCEPACKLPRRHRGVIEAPAANLKRT